ncbi:MULTISPECIES: acyl carrier protein [unclassified Streptomyces]|uniref:acyl carrier protein n=1 Tax=unclassified Streptomyces TaxID=2593676 RepID=UPI0029AF1B7A|nr:acyl carrier protein [Streptomyces sp. DK15]MDX2395107.1 acyl carrier protein [Streptomyces sp. DK15]
MTDQVHSHKEVMAVLGLIWEEVLETTVNDPDENFIDLGGDSLLALVIANRAQEAGLTMPPSGVLRRPTLRELTEAVMDPRLFEQW